MVEASREIRRYTVSREPTHPTPEAYYYLGRRVRDPLVRPLKLALDIAVGAVISGAAIGAIANIPQAYKALQP